MLIFSSETKTNDLRKHCLIHISKLFSFLSIRKDSFLFISTFHLQFWHLICFFSLHYQSAEPGRPSPCRRLNTVLHLRGPTPPSPTAAPPPPAATRLPLCWAHLTFTSTPRRPTHTHTRTRWAALPPLPSGRMTA